MLIPGNHDDREAFRGAFGSDHDLPATGPLHVVAGNLGPVRIIGLDVTVPGAHHGDASEEVLAWLADALSADPDRPTVVVVHQPPFATGVGCLDEHGCRNGAALAALLERHRCVQAVWCGHVHRSMQTRFASILASAAPSTATTIALRLDAGAEPASFLEPPAMLLHHWNPGRGFVTHHVPIGVFAGPMPFA